MSADLLTSKTLPDRKGGVWSYRNPSRLHWWLKCPLAFRLRYLEGITAPPGTDMFAVKMARAALEHFYRHWQLGIPMDTGDICWQLATASSGPVSKPEAARDTTSASPTDGAGGRRAVVDPGLLKQACPPRQAA
jgi:hypothetical protein